MKIYPAFLVTTPLALPLAAAQPPAMLGNWSLNVAKSKFDPGPLPQSETRSYQMNGDSITLTEQVVAADGQTHAVNSTFKLDNKPYPISGNPNLDTIRTRPVSRWETRGIQMRGGKIVGHMNSAVSKDGKTRTLTETITTPSGSVEHQTLVFDRA